MNAALALLALNCSYVPIGYTIAGPLVRQVPAGIARFALAYVAGCIVVGLATTYLALAGVGLSPWAVVGLAVAGATRELRRFRARTHRTPSSRRTPPKLSSVAEIAVVAMICVFGAILVIAAAESPLNAEDGWAIWGLK